MSNSNPNKTKRTKRNSYIELWRFIACIIIALFHLGNNVFYQGWLFVEFFFILSGYFAYKAVLEHRSSITDPASYPVEYTWNRIKKLLPYTTISLLVFFLLKVFSYRLNLRDSLKFFVYSLENMSLLNGTGMVEKTFTVNDSYTISEMFMGPLWYICAIIVAMPIMLYIVYYLNDKLGLFIVTILPLLLDGYIVINDGMIHGWHGEMLHFLTLDVRALAGLLAGGFVYHLSKRLRNISFTRFGIAILFVIELASMLSVVLLCLLNDTVYSLYPFIALVISLSITFSGITPTSKINLKLFDSLGKISLAVYCTHSIVIEHFYHPNIAIYLSEIILTGIALHLIVLLFHRFNLLRLIRS